MKVLVLGGTGTVGRQVVERLLPLAEEVRVATRSLDRLAHLPDGVAGVLADLTRPETLPDAVSGADAVCLITALGPTEADEGVAAVEAVRTSGVRRCVYMSVVQPPGAERIPHFASKAPIERALARAGVEHTVIRPNCFMQNDLWYLDTMLKHGVYPQPIGARGVSMVDVRDIADAIVSALVRGGVDGRTVSLHGPEALTGERVAATWSRHLGREVAPVVDDVDGWARQAGATLPPWMVDDLVVMWRFFQEHGLAASAAELAAQEELVGHPPRRHADFVAEAAAGR